MQADPNAAAMTIVGSAALNGRGLSALVAAFSMEDRYSDGPNLYEYLGSNPWGGSDPLGLSWDSFDMVDEHLAASTGSQAPNQHLPRVPGAAGRCRACAAVEG